MQDAKVAVTLRLPADLKWHLELLADQEARTLNGLLVYLLQRASRFERPLVSAGQPAPVAIPKVGRNEPCPCGSGKKYKQCHGR
jgi:uncharacterized protein YecA (UPF0149 family)